MMKVEESEQGATPEELVELVDGFFLLMSKHKLWELTKGIKDDETGLNLYDRALEIMTKMRPELKKELKTYPTE